MNIPQNNEAEQALLGALILYPDNLVDVATQVSPSDFYVGAYKTIYGAMLSMMTSGSNIDITTLSETLSASNKLSEIGGVSRLVGLSNSAMTSSHIGEYVRIVKDKSVRRLLLSAQEQNLSAILDERKDLESVIADVQSNIMRVQLHKHTDDDSATIVRELEEAQKEYAEKFEQGKKYLGIPTGFEKIDNMIDGLRPGHVWVVGAWTSTGKTQMSMNILHNVVEQNVPSALISLEMSRIDTLARLVGIRHRMSAMAVLKAKNLRPDQFENIKEAKIFFSQTPLQVHTTYFDIEKIKMLIRRDVMKYKTRFFIIDYVQNIMSEKGIREYELITQASIDLQALARELGVTVYIVSQISNESQKGNGAGAGFKGTGALEAVADIAIRLERNKGEEQPDWEYVPLTIKIAKNRHGFSGVIQDHYMWLDSGKVESNLMPPATVTEIRARKDV
jgi:replicative DNA helicase